MDQERMDGSNVSVHSSLSVIERVGSFLGVSQEHSQLDLWNERLKHRAQSGELGIHLFDKTRDQNEVVLQLEKTILQISTKEDGDTVNIQPSAGCFSPVKQPTFPDVAVDYGSGRNKAMKGHENDARIELGQKRRHRGVESDSFIMSPRGSVAADYAQHVRHRTSVPSQTISTPALSSALSQPERQLNISANAATLSVSEEDDSRSAEDGQSRSATPESGTSDQRGRIRRNNDTTQVIPDTFNVDSSQFLSGQDAMNNYLKYAMKERQEKVIKVTERKNIMEAGIEAKMERLGKAMTTVRRYYAWYYSHRSKTLLGRIYEKCLHPGADRARNTPELPSFLQRAEDYHKTPGMPRFYPYFTYAICIINLLAFAVSTIVNTPLADMGVEPKQKLDTYLTFRGSEADVCWKIPNVWIGITMAGLIKSGSVYAPCMRDDIIINAQYAAQGLADTLDLGCCEVDVEGRRLAGTTTKAECEKDTGGIGTWSESILCSERNTTRSLYILHRIKPCCVGLKGRCRMVVKEHCEFLKGRYYDSGPENCRYVNCLQDVCGFSGMASDSKQKYKPHNANQQWRFLLAVVLHPGVLQVIIVIFLQFLVGQELEVVAGWLRVAIIYVLSCVGGLAMGAAFTPYLPHLGGKAGVFGELAALLLELIQSWKLVKHPHLELVKILGIVIVFMVTGSLPLLDNWELFGGLMFGALISVIVLPYITFGRWDVLQKKIMLAVTVPFTIVLYILVLYLVLEVQNAADNCAWCRKFNCASYTDNNCEIENLI